MQNIRISLNLLSIPGTRVVRMNNANGTPEVYAAIPVSQLFVPTDRPQPRLMGTMIHTPNAQYGDFMIKPYLSNADYKMLSKEEQQNLPIIGKGSFMQIDNNRVLAKEAVTADVQDIDPTQIPTTEGNFRPAAPLADAPSPANGRNDAADAEPGRYFVVNISGQSLQQCANLDDAKIYADSNPEAVAIQLWGNNGMQQAWVFDEIVKEWTLTTK